MSFLPMTVCQQKPRTHKRSALKLKRLTDAVLSLAAILFLWPVLAVVAIAIMIDSPGSPIFKQKRIGLHGHTFEIYKFRTMYVGTPNVATELMVRMERSPITKVGGILRKTSIDELPQLFNILQGDMSIVGPRPALYNQYELTAKRQSQGVLEMPPGITGWAQINGRDELSDDQKVAFDTWYCDNWTYMLDWKIIFQTIAAVVTRRGAF